MTQCLPQTGHGRFVDPVHMISYKYLTQRDEDRRAEGQNGEELEGATRQGAELTLGAWLSYCADGACFVGPARRGVCATP